MPLAEATEVYRVEILNGSNVVRVIEGLSMPAAHYSAAEQTTDFGSVQATVAVRIYQLSALAGKGITAQAAV